MIVGGEEYTLLGRIWPYGFMVGYHTVMAINRTKRSQRRSSAAPLSFRTFLRCLRPNQAPLEEFIALAKRDPSFPNPQTWQELRWHLNKIGAEDGVFIGGRLAWRKYESVQRERAKRF